MFNVFDKFCPLILAALAAGGRLVTPQDSAAAIETTSTRVSSLVESLTFPLVCRYGYRGFHRPAAGFYCTKE
jgi:hypothetical protein